MRGTRRVNSLSESTVETASLSWPSGLGQATEYVTRLQQIIEGSHFPIKEVRRGYNYQIAVWTYKKSGRPYPVDWGTHTEK